jgi:hypothetical protein
MDFFKLVQSLDELIYEVMSWLVFYPITMWRMLRHPLKTMRAAELQLKEPDADQFDKLLAPPLFLLLTLMLVHAIELGTVGESDIVTSSKGFKGLINSDTGLIVFQILIFSILPLAASVRLLRASKQEVGRDALRAPFFAQSFAAAFFALLWSTAGLIAEENFEFGGPAHLAILALALGWLFVIEAHWFAAELKAPLKRGFIQAAIMVAEWLFVLALIGFLLS